MAKFYVFHIAAARIENSFGEKQSHRSYYYDSEGLSSLWWSYSPNGIAGGEKVPLAPLDLH